MLSIWKMKIENYKAISVMEMDLKGKSVVVVGANESGKSSLIDSIYKALTGQDIPKEPIKQGEYKGYIEVEVKDGENAFTVRKEFRKDKRPMLIVTTNDNAKYSSPQEFLNKKIGDISFDPFEFIRLKPLPQKRMLEQMLGIDLSYVENKKKESLSARKDIAEKGKYCNREIESIMDKKKILEKEIKELGVIDGDTKETINEKIKAVMSKKEQIGVLELNLNQYRSEYHSLSNKLESLQLRKNTSLDNIKEYEQKIKLEKDNIEAYEKMESEIKDKDQVEIQKRGNNAKKSLDELKKQISNFNIDDLESRKEDLIKYEEKNKQLNQISNEINQKNNLFKSIEDRKKEINNEIKQIEEERVKILSSKSIGIEGLEITEDGVMFKGLPLSENQLSTSTIIKIGVQLLISINPKLKILKIKDWNLIDDNNQKLLLELSKKHGYQLFAEEVASGEKLGFKIIDET